MTTQPSARNPRNRDFFTLLRLFVRKIWIFVVIFYVLVVILFYRTWYHRSVPNQGQPADHDSSVGDWLLHNQPLRDGETPGLRSHDRSTILVSYIVRAIRREHISAHRSNIDTFISRGVCDDEQVTFVFTFIGDSIKPSRLLRKKQKSFSNVIVQSRRQFFGELPSDLMVQGQVLRQYLGTKNVFILLNSETRGPYYPSTFGIPSFYWIDIFTNKLDSSGVKIVGATISCERHPHVQRFAMALDADAARLAVIQWANATVRTDTFALEVALSKAVLDRGFNIAAMDSRYESRDFRGVTGTNCDPEYSYMNSRYLNPTVCHGVYADSPGCQGLEPCEVMFVRTGDYFPDKTSGRMHVIESDFNSNSNNKQNKDKNKNIVNNNTAPNLCLDRVAGTRQYVDVATIYHTLSSSHEPFRRNFDNLERRATLALLVRAHTNYGMSLMSLILTLESISSEMKNVTMLVIVVPTEYEAISVLRSHLSDLMQLGTISHRVRLMLFEAPNDLYQMYGSLLNSTLCTPQWKQFFRSKQTTEFEISRWCSVNSPLHYTLVDIALYYAKFMCVSCKQVLITNADNYYAPSFFREVVNNYNDSDIVMTDMITKGNLLTVEARRSRVDLGSYAVRLDFLRKTNTSFLNALPKRPDAHDYHDADGHFIERLVAHHARVKHVNRVYFFHN